MKKLIVALVLCSSTVFSASRIQDSIVCAIPAMICLKDGISSLQSQETQKERIKASILMGASICGLIGIAKGYFNPLVDLIDMSFIPCLFHEKFDVLVKGSILLGSPVVLTVNSLKRCLNRQTNTDLAIGAIKATCGCAAVLVFTLHTINKLLMNRPGS